eukprot:CAMPEP_0185908588 /NCGR_PEP_ID=MMETSP0196C-20130402/9237_1 /TAXON_ID=2932 /ORGANISM="Alexandrium fundyense, Strain CCMP1719" /LENGTH=53 /DNA_ID=CAMNT_0028628865 /DNA_START=19 /DNA_END=177 /DNA_ORIENTATION=+
MSSVTSPWLAMGAVACLAVAGLRERRRQKPIASLVRGKGSVLPLFQPHRNVHI